MKSCRGLLPYVCLGTLTFSGVLRGLAWVGGVCRRVNKFCLRCTFSSWAVIMGLPPTLLDFLTSAAFSFCLYLSSNDSSSCCFSSTSSRSLDEDGMKTFLLCLLRGLRTSSSSSSLLSSGPFSSLFFLAAIRCIFLLFLRTTLGSQLA